MRHLSAHSISQKIIVPLLVAVLSVGLASCADIFLAINPNGSEGQICTGLFVTGEEFDLCRRDADGALGAFDVFIEDLVVDADGNIVLAGSLVVGRAELTQSFGSGDELATVFWQLKDTDNTLLRLDEIAANADVVLSLVAGNTEVGDALDFIDDFTRFYNLNFNIQLAAEESVTYGIDHFFECISNRPEDRDILCARLYDLDGNGTLNTDDYVDLIAIVESPEAAAEVFPSAVFSSATLTTYYSCSDQAFTEDDPITAECALLDLDRNDTVDLADLQLLFDSGEEADNSAPAALAGADQEVTAGDTVTLDASQSVDLETLTSSLRFAWAQVSGTSVTLDNANTARAQFEAPSVVSNTVLEFSVTVTDSGALSDSDTVAITVLPSGPLSDAGIDQQVDAGVLVTLDGSGSSGTDLTFGWTEIGGSTVSLSSNSTEKPVFTAPTVTEATVVTFQLVVTDGNGLQDSDTVDITILPGASGATLVASAGADQQLTEGTLVTLDATASTGSGLTYAWEQLSGTTVTLSSSTTAQPVFIAPNVTNPETLSFRVTVQDDQSNTDTDEVDVTILDSP
ncbi:MAG: hypothetical protein IID41_08425 [Planctomycetes bacterium]|nr:hypothetical protein [Planctomycetota bacterium]